MLLAGISAALLSAGILLLTPAALGRVLDAVGAGAAARPKLNKDATLLLGLYILGALAKLVEVCLLRLAGERIVFGLRNKLFRKLVRNDVAALDATTAGTMLSRLQSDSYDLQAVVCKELPQFITGFAETMLGFGMLFYICPQLAPVALLSVPLTVLAGLYYGRRTANFSRSLSAALARASDVASEQLSNARVVKSFSREALSETKYNEQLHAVLGHGNSVAIADGILQSWNRLVFTVKTVAILWLGGRFVVAGSLSVGGLFSFAIYTSNVAASLGKFAGGWGELIRSSGSISRVLEILRGTPTIEQTPADNLAAAVTHAVKDKHPSVTGMIEFRNVTFAYSGREETPALRNASLHIPAGSSIGICGVSGGGKSTMAALLLRFYDPTSGAVLIDGKPLHEYDLRFIRETVIGIVPQAPNLFTGTVADNIAFGKAGATEDEILQAAEDAGVMEFASQLPLGLNTQVYAGAGGGLSGGQMQRLCIARCLIGQPRILLFDEATANLDNASCAMVQTTIRRLMADGRRTVVLISHQMNIVGLSDRIAVLARGIIEEVGTHEELAAKSGSLYSKLLAADAVEHLPLSVSSSIGDSSSSEST
jgi:ABC-type multidrug transport system fused ATPase/permease subunit